MNVGADGARLLGGSVLLTPGVLLASAVDGRLGLVDKTGVRLACKISETDPNLNHRQDVPGHCRRR